MIGIGTDIVETGRIARLIERYEEHFIRKVFTPAERRYCDARKHRAMHYAARWAVKEAFYKALPPQLQKISFWKSIEVVNVEESGRPTVSLCSHTLQEGFRSQGVQNVHCSISHEREYCVAFVVLE